MPADNLRDKVVALKSTSNFLRVKPEIVDQLLAHPLYRELSNAQLLNLLPKKLREHISPALLSEQGCDNSRAAIIGLLPHREGIVSWVSPQGREMKPLARVHAMPEHSAKHYAFPLTLTGLQLDPRRAVRVAASSNAAGDAPIVVPPTQTLSLDAATV